MLREFPRRPVSRLISAALTVGMALLGAPPAQAGSHDNRDQNKPQRPPLDLRGASLRTERQRVPIQLDHTGSVGPFSWKQGAVGVFVKMKGESAAEAYARLVSPSGAKDKGADVDAAGSDAAFNQAKAVAQQRDADQRTLLPALQGMGATVIYRAQKAVNGIAIHVDASRLAAIRQLKGVEAVYPLTPKERQTSTSIPFLEIPSAAWDSGTGLGLTGTGIKIGIIDTGIDYLHANFGGTGALADYTTEKANTSNFTSAGSFPTARVVGGTDLVGDAYNANDAVPVLVPDANPMDCNGHGSHVAGIAAGGGVNLDGTPYTGPYDGSTNTLGMRIGPGVAPNASLYAIRVFGCGGSTNVVAEALDWAMDPNNDGNMKDHLQVVNMSLGSSYGLGFDADAVASDAAAAVGVIVVASAGNSGDAYFVTGAPAASSRTISVASGTDLSLVAQTSVGSFVAGSASFGPPVTTTPFPVGAGTVVQVVNAGGAPSVGGTDPGPNDGCLTPFDNAGAISGNVALVRRGGGCGFTVKVKNAQNAGATAVIVYNHPTGGNALVTMGGADPTITIPSVFVGNGDGTFLAGFSGSATADLLLENAGDRLSSFSSRGPRRVFGLKPDITAPGDAITSTQSGHTCTSSPPTGCIVPDNAAPTTDGFIPGSQSLTIGGTSMAAPHVAGVMALLREQHPGYTGKFLKALVMNTATNDVYTQGFFSGFRIGPGRVGAGRVDVPNALADKVTVQSTQESSTVVSATVRKDITLPNQVIRTLQLANNGTSSVSFSVFYDRVVAQPGVVVSLPDGPFVSVGAHGLATYRVQFDYDPSALPNTHDPSISELLAGGAPFITGFVVGRNWLAEEAGYVVFQSGGPSLARGQAGSTLRVPIHSAVRGASNLKATGPNVAYPTIGTTGIDYFTTTGGGFPFSTGGYDELAIGGVYEWQYESPNQGLPFGSEADLRHVGIATGGPWAYVALSNFGSWDSMNHVEYDIYIDVDNDQNPDFVEFNFNSNASSTSPSDSFFTVLCDLNVGGCFLEDYVNLFSPAAGDTYIGFPMFTRLMENSVAVMPLYLPDMGITGRFNYAINTFSREAPGSGFVEGTPWLSFDPSAPGIDFVPNNGLFGITPFVFDEAGSTYTYAFNAASFAADGALGALFLHHHNMEGARSEGLRLTNWVSVSNGSLSEGNSGKHDMTFTVSLNAPATQTFNVTLQTYDISATAAGLDYIPKTQAVIFSAGQTTKNFTVKIKGDTIPEPDETFGVRILNTTKSTPASTTDAVGTIINDDGP